PAARKKFVVLDARPRKAYEAGHVPGAVWVDVAGWGRAFAAGQGAEGGSPRGGALGGGPDSAVVGYGAGEAPRAGRVSWILRYWGVKALRLLNGGWPAWLAAGGQADRERVTPAPTRPRLVAQPGRLAAREQLLAALKAGKPPQILDTRSAAEHCGTEARAK